MKTAIEKALTARINDEHRAVEEAARSAVEHAIRCGEMLQEVKESLPHGAFGPWLRENFAGSKRTAQTYMKLFRGRDSLDAKTQHAADFSIRGALRELEAPKDKPEPAGSYSEERRFWNHIAMSFEDHFNRLACDDEIPLILRRFRKGPAREADYTLMDRVADVHTLLAPEFSSEVQREFVVMAATTTIYEDWLLDVVLSQGSPEQKSRRLQYEAGKAEDEALEEDDENEFEAARRRRASGEE